MAVKLGEYCSNVFALTLFNTLISEGFNPSGSPKAKKSQIPGLHYMNLAVYFETSKS